MFIRPTLVALGLISAVMSTASAAPSPCPGPGENPPLGPWTYETGLSTDGTVTYIVQGYASVPVMLTRNVEKEFELPDVAGCGIDFASARAEITFVVHPNNFPVKIVSIDARTAAPKVKYKLVSTQNLNVAAQIHYTIYVYSRLMAGKGIVKAVTPADIGSVPPSVLDALVAKLSSANVSSILAKMSAADLDALKTKVFDLPPGNAARKFVLAVLNSVQSSSCTQTIVLTPPAADAPQERTIKFSDYNCWFAFTPGVQISYNPSSGDSWSQESLVVSDRGFTLNITPHGGHGQSITAASTMTFTATPRPWPTQ